MPDEISQSQSSKCCSIPLTGAPSGRQVQGQKERWVARGRGRGHRLVFLRDKASVWEDDTVLKMDGGAALHISVKCLMPLNCTLKNGSDGTFYVRFYNDIFINSSIRGKNFMEN